jgi:hypothetical protein
MSSRDFLMLSTDVITEDDFIALLTDLGAVIKPAPYEIGRISDGDRHLWISLNGEPMDSLLEGVEEDVVRLLGGEPQSSVVVHYSMRPGAGRLGLNFAIAFAERWRAIAYSAQDCLLSPADLRRLAQEEGDVDWSSRPVVVVPEQKPAAPNAH